VGSGTAGIILDCHETPSFLKQRCKSAGIKGGFPVLENKKRKTTHGITPQVRPAMDTSCACAFFLI